MNIAFVLGNGKSRLAVDLENLRSHGRIYGCNALYRDFAPDVLVATDPGISSEIEDSGYALINEFYTRKPKDGSGSLRLGRFYGYSSGPNALHLAIAQGAEKIFMLGFDLDSPVDHRFNNVYAGTPNYKALGDDETFYGNWVSQVTEVIGREIVQVVRVNDNNHTPDSWRKLIREVSVREFLDAINNSKLEAL